jgi:hypothetical protein
MNANFILSLLNNPITMVVLGSTMGWLFASYVWAPYNAKKEKKREEKEKTKY